MHLLLLNGSALVISFVLAENPVVILIKELDLVKPAIKDKVFNNSYKRTGASCVFFAVGHGCERDFSQGC